MPRKKGFKSPNSRTETLGTVRLTDAEKSAIRTNAKNSNLSVASFVRARTIPPVSDSEQLTDPKPGQGRRLNRTPLTRALQRILLNMQQVDPYMDAVQSDELFNEFIRVRTALRDLQTDHLNASIERTKPRMAFVADLNLSGRVLNRTVSISHREGEIKEPAKLKEIISEIGQIVETIIAAGEGGK